MMHPAVADAGVIGVPVPVMGQTTNAFVQLGPAARASDALAGERLEFLRDKIAVYRPPREFAFVERLPGAAGPAGPGTGKLLRRLLRQQQTESATR